jgi:hypothetical protein
MSYYCVKSIIIHRLTETDYDRIKAVTAIKEESRDAQSLAAVFYNPENIVKRMNFSVTKEQQAEATAASPNEPNAAPQPPAGD